MAMTKPQRVRWSRAVDRATTAIESAIYELEQSFRQCPVRDPMPGETKDEEREGLAADCIQEAIGCLEGAKDRLGACDTHINWERDKAQREWPLKMRKALEAHRATLPADVIALLDGKDKPRG